jgi:hypothetical protein
MQLIAQRFTLLSQGPPQTVVLTTRQYAPHRLIFGQRSEL